MTITHRKLNNCPFEVIQQIQIYGGYQPEFSQVCKLWNSAYQDPITRELLIEAWYENPKISPYLPPHSPHESLQSIWEAFKRNFPRRCLKNIAKKIMIGDFYRALRIAQKDIASKLTDLLYLNSKESFLRNFYKLSITLQNDLDFRLELITYSSYILSIPPFQIDRDLFRAALKKDGTLIEYADPILKTDRELALLAVANSPSALQYISPDLQIDEEIVRKALKHYSSDYVEEEMLRSFDHHFGASNNTLKKFSRMVNPYNPTNGEIDIEAIFLKALKKTKKRLNKAQSTFASE